jgi:exopolyphosphatase/guanosine-5'-triphosphate,3'-diphosphate pyrophosphatase
MAGGGRFAAVIDVGSNSVLLLAIAVAADGRSRALDEATTTTRLGAGLSTGGTLDPTAAARTRAAVVAFARRARALGVGDLWGFATGAARRAADGADFVAATAAEAGLPVEILTGEREARLAYDAVVHGLGLDDGRTVLVVDVGGASTELTLGRGSTVVATVSLALGALELHERAASDPATMAPAVARAIADTDLPARARRAGATLAASGGTPTSLAALALDLRGYDPRRVHGASLDVSALADLAGRATGTGPIDPGRAAILPAGACILEAVMRASGVTRVTVSDHGVRHAYLRERLARSGARADLRTLWT